MRANKNFRFLIHFTSLLFLSEKHHIQIGFPNYPPFHLQLPKPFLKIFLKSKGRIPPYFNFSDANSQSRDAIGVCYEISK